MKLERIAEIQRIVRNYYEELYAKKCENLDEMEKFLEKYNLPKLNEEEAENLNRPKTADKIAAVIKKLTAHKNPGPDGFTGEFQRAFKGELTSILHRLFEKIQEDGKIPNKESNPESQRTRRTTSKAQIKQNEGNDQDQSRIK